MGHWNYHHSMNLWKFGCGERHMPGVRKVAISIQRSWPLTYLMYPMGLSESISYMDVVRLLDGATDEYMSEVTKWLEWANVNT